MSRLSNITPQIDRSDDRLLRLRLGLPVELLSKDIPFGYEKTDKFLLEPIEEEYKLLHEVYEYYVAGQSLRAISDYIQYYTGKKLSLEGVRKILTERPPMQEAYGKSLEERHQIWKRLKTT